MRRFLHGAAVAAVLAGAMLAGSGAARAQAADDLAQRAQAAYAKNDFAAAVPAFRALVAANPNDPTAAFRLGVSLQATGALDEAQTWYERAHTLGFNEYGYGYRMATLEAVRGHGDAAVAFLKKANAVQGFPPEVLQGDPHFTGLAKNAAFVALVDAQQRAFHPCRFDPAYRAMDFWIGNWSVAAGLPANGKSHVDLILGNCVIYENWTSPAGTEGKSFTSYDATAHVWRQHWVDDAGSITDYEGTVDGNGVRYLAKTTVKGKPRTIRMTLAPLPDGRVHHLFEHSDDNMTTWSTDFDGYYTRVPAAGA